MSCQVVAELHSSQTRNVLISNHAGNFHLVVLSLQLLYVLFLMSFCIQLPNFRAEDAVSEADV